MEGFVLVQPTPVQQPDEDVEHTVHTVDDTQGEDRQQQPMQPITKASGTGASSSGAPIAMDEEDHFDFDRAVLDEEEFLEMPPPEPCFGFVDQWLEQDQPPALPGQGPEFEGGGSEEIRSPSDGVDMFGLPRDQQQQRFASNVWPSRVAVLEECFVFGVARVHCSHILRLHSGHDASLLFCEMCGGLTVGSSSLLLARPCRHRITSTRASQVRRVIATGVWPTAAQRSRYGRAQLSPAISVHPLSGVIAQMGVGSAGGQHAGDSASI